MQSSDYLRSVCVSVCVADSRVLHLNKLIFLKNELFKKKKNLTVYIAQYWTITSGGYFYRECVCVEACEHLCITTLSFAVFNLPSRVYKLCI